MFAEHGSSVSMLITGLLMQIKSDTIQYSCFLGDYWKFGRSFVFVLWRLRREVTKNYSNVCVGTEDLVTHSKCLGNPILGCNSGIRKCWLISYSINKNLASNFCCGNNWGELCFFCCL